MAELPIAYLAKVEVHSFPLCFLTMHNHFAFPVMSLRSTVVARQLAT